VDADAHVIETEETWEYMTADESQYCKPISVDPGRPIELTLNEPGGPKPHRYWIVDGRAAPRRWRSDERASTSLALREMRDVPGRLRHMDEIGVDVQVIYPTLLLHAPSPRPDVELAIYRSYNRWLADRAAEANGRLRWVVMPPVRSMDKAIEEIRWAKEHGAAGVFKRAIECGGKSVADPYFFPLYEEAQALDLPMCVHTGQEDFSSSSFAHGFVGPLIPAIGCFTALYQSDVPKRFPKLRFGVIEAMASWATYIIADLMAKSRNSGDAQRLKEDFMRENRFYVACQTSDDDPGLLRYGAGDNLLIGTDYGHVDQSAVIDALNHIERLGEEGEIPIEASKKILVDNPRAFYGL
jgi:aminocarboxymuconate-semialdehyde decarboxylase